jgi:hypothetical protein
MMSTGHHFIDTQGESRHLLVALDGRVKLSLMLAGLGVNLVAGGIRTPLLLALLALLLMVAKYKSATSDGERRTGQLDFLSASTPIHAEIRTAKLSILP